MTTPRRARLLSAALIFAGATVLAQETIENWPAPALWSPPADLVKEIDTFDTEAVEAVPTPPLHFVGLTPCRLADTRGNGFTGQYGPPALVAGVARNFVLTGQCGISATAQAVSLNVTVTAAQGPGHIVIYPAGGAEPTVSTLNYVGAQTVANAAVVPLGTGGAITVVAGVSGTHLILDTNGDYRAGVVTSVNSLSGNVTLAAGSNVTITPSGQTLTVAATGGPGGSLPVGSANQTLRHNGTSWIASGALTNDGTDVGLTGILALPAPARVTSGGVRFLHNHGLQNIFLGASAGNFTMTGQENVGVGFNALANNATGSNNTALGARAMQNATAGIWNVAVGSDALSSNSGDGNTALGRATLSTNGAGVFNTAVGSAALNSNSGDSNTAVGATALNTNGTGDLNTAVGRDALGTNGGSFNTALGADALSHNGGSSNNTAVGNRSMFSGGGGGSNTAVGYNALQAISNGSNNIAIGSSALADVITGSGNIAIGNTAAGLTSGSNNLYIGNPGTGGNESGQIRIGNNAVHTQGTVIASIFNFNAIGGSPVYVTGGGRLGTITASSVRYKDDVREIGSESDRLMDLHPVAFRYKPEIDPAGVPQYGLIAEEVAQVYPDLAECDSSGRPQGVRYHLLAPLLLNELQKERQTNDAQRAEIDALKSRLEKLETLLREKN